MCEVRFGLERGSQRLFELPGCVISIGAQVRSVLPGRKYEISVCAANDAGMHTVLRLKACERTLIVCELQDPVPAASPAGGRAR